ncbi:hypothetical protein FB446DRAFT_609311, partial [Lentinula raphanica]
HTCKGALVHWTPGKTWLTYNFAMHSHDRNPLPWELARIVDGDTLYIRSLSCKVSLSGLEEISSGCCVLCSTVPNQNRFRDFMDLAAEQCPTRSGIRFEQLTHSQLVAVIKRKTQEQKRLRMKIIRCERRIRHLQQRLDDHKRLLMLISMRNIPGLRCLIAVTLKQGCSPVAIVTRLERALKGKGLARSGFNQRDFDTAFLVKALGGPSLLRALHRAEGYAALSTIEKHRPIPRLLPCLKSPTREEICMNMNQLLDPNIRKPPSSLSSGILPGIIVMIDGVALEEVPQYESHRDSLVGLCREHSKDLNLQLDSYKAIEAIGDALDNSKCHLGKDGTVLAIAPVSDREQYSPVPLILSPSCKKESGTVLKDWLQLFMTVWQEHPYGEALYGPIRSLASDGESSFRLARFQLCMSKEVEPLSILGQVVCRLPGLNRQTGPTYILGTCDYKHVFKRFATLLRGWSGILVNDTVISSQDFCKSLMMTGLEEEEARNLLDPADKQNVPKAVRLLQSLRAVHDLPAPAHPDERKRRTAINFVMETLDYFLQPFIDINMNLEDQCHSLAIYAHLTAAMYLKGRLSFLTSALYADSHAIVKNIIFTVAKLTLDNPDTSYYIILDGTDRIERVFLNVRTQDHNRNFDTQQLAQKLSISAKIVATLTRNPDLDFGHRRLNLCGAIGIDHVNPASCKGNYRVADVSLTKVWSEAAMKANSILEQIFDSSVAIDYVESFSAPDCDFLRPFGGKYVGTSFDDELIEDNTQDIVHTETDVDVEEESDSSGLASLDDYLDLHESMHADDQKSFDRRFLEVADPEDQSKTQRFLKSSLVRIICGGEKVRRKVNMRTLRAQGVTIEDLQKKSKMEWDSTGNDNNMKVGDPAAVLVRIGKGKDTQVCLVVITAVGFSIPGVRGFVSEAALDQLEAKGDKCPAVIAQVLELVPEGDVDPLSWVWTGGYVRNMSDMAGPSISTQKHFRLTIPGNLVHPLAAKIIELSPLSSLPSTWQFSSKDLADSREYAWSELSPDAPDECLSNMEMLPSFPTKNPQIPYRTNDGLSALLIVNIPVQALTSKIDGSSEVKCFICD